MTVVTRTPIGRVALNAALVLPFAAMACGGDESTSTASDVDARPIATVARVEPPRTPVMRDLGGPTAVAPPRTFDTAADAFTAGEFRTAATMYKDHVSTQPDDAKSHYMLGLSSWKAGDFAAAKTAFDRAIELDPTSARSYFNLGRVLLDLKRVPEAIEVIEKGRAIDSTSSEGWRLVARAQQENGDIEGAMTTYRVLLVRDETDSWGLNNLGMLLLGRGELQDALGAFARAVQLRGTAPLFQNNLGMALEKSGYPFAALRHYELAVQHDSGFVKAVRNVERIKGLQLEGAPVVEVDVRELAEQFRLRVRSWKVEVQKIEVPPIDPR